MTEAAKRDKDRQFELEALRWFPDLTRYALSLTRNEADADDLVQETFLRAYSSWDTYKPGTECRGWLFTICRNSFLRTRQREERQVQTEDAELEALAAVAVHESAKQSGYGSLFAESALSDAIDRALAELSDAFRDVALLVDVNDQSFADAAATLGVPIGTVRSRLFRARRLLQESFLTYARDAGMLSARDGTCRRNGGNTVRFFTRWFGGAKAPMLDCESVMRQLWDYLDGELTPERMEAISNHIAMCSRCHPQTEFERAFLAAVNRSQREHSHVDRLRVQLLDSLRKEGFAPQ